jgi:hypothetical protein
MLNKFIEKNYKQEYIIAEQEKLIADLQGMINTDTRKTKAHDLSITSTQHNCEGYSTPRKRESFKPDSIIDDSICNNNSVIINSEVKFSIDSERIKKESDSLKNSIAFENNNNNSINKVKRAESDVQIMYSESNKIKTISLKDKIEKELINNKLEKPKTNTNVNRTIEINYPKHDKRQCCLNRSMSPTRLCKLNNTITHSPQTGHKHDACLKESIKMNRSPIRKAHNHDNLSTTEKYILNKK